jgi:hypothetical protein
LVEEDLVDFPGNRKLGLELTDPALRRRELERLVGAQPVDLTAVNLVLAAASCRSSPR